MKSGSNIFKLFSHILVLTIVLIMSVAFTFSWYAPGVTNSEGDDLGYKINGKINNFGGIKEIATYGSENKDGIITYSDEVLTDSQKSVTIPSGCNAVYFRTVITSDNTGDSLVSLYVNGIDGDAYVGVYSPEKTYEKVKETPYCIADNLVVPNNDSITVYWYIAGAEGATVKFGNLFVAYN